MPAPPAEPNLWSEMADHGSSTIAIHSSRAINTDRLDNEFRPFEGFVGITVIHPGRRTWAGAREASTYLIHFGTAADAARAIGSKPSVTLARHQYTVEMVEASELPEMADESSPPAMSPRQERVRVAPPAEEAKCVICCSAIQGTCHRPCRDCRGLWCESCVRTLFLGATQDHERMPARCCDKVIHHRVAATVLSPAELDLYKTRYEEFCTANPLYCPVPTCSAFIPPRLAGPLSVGHQISCHRCATAICLKCKQTAEVHHQCARTEAGIARIKLFNYKLCPKCGTGVMKMYGCPHVRCACGAHWCYECQRPINACYRRPCRAQVDYGEDDLETFSPDGEGLGDDQGAGERARWEEMPQWPEDIRNLQTPVPEDIEILAEARGMFDVEAARARQVDIETAAAVAATSDPAVPTAESAVETGMAPPPPELNTAPVESGAATRPAGESPRPASPAPSHVNLDDPDRRLWEAEALNFGGEPDSEAWDVWGCQHYFRPLYKPMVAGWLDLETGPPVECLRCFEPVTPQEECRKEKKGKGKHRERETVTWAPRAVRVLRVAPEAEAEAEAEGPKAVQPTPTAEERRREARWASDCCNCGVIYCNTCRKDVLEIMMKRDLWARNAQRERERARAAAAQREREQGRGRDRARTGLREPEAPRVAEPETLAGGAEAGEPVEARG